MGNPNHDPKTGEFTSGPGFSHPSVNRAVEKMGGGIEQTGPYSIRPAENGRKGYDVFKDTSTASVRVAQIGYEGDKGLLRARDEVARRISGK